MDIRSSSDTRLLGQLVLRRLFPDFFFFFFFFKEQEDEQKERNPEKESLSDDLRILRSLHGG